MAAAPIQKPDLVHEVAIAIPGGKMLVIYARLTQGQLPSVYIAYEPDEASPARTRVRDAVFLLNALRAWGNPRLLQTLIDADKQLHEILLPAKSVMEAP